MNLRILICLSFLLPWNLMATQQCPPEAECEASPEMKLSVLAYINALLEPCSKLKPEKASEYHNKYNELQQNLYKNMKEHPMYSDVIKGYKGIVDNMSERSIKEECRSLLPTLSDELKALNN